LLQGSFIKWIHGKYNNVSSKEKLFNDAKDAFQMGMLKIIEKARKNELAINGSLKTTVYSYGLLQLLTIVKQERSEGKRQTVYITLIDLLIEHDYVIKEMGIYLTKGSRLYLKP
jgi:hypothetical protein